MSKVKIIRSLTKHKLIVKQKINITCTNDKFVYDGYKYRNYRQFCSIYRIDLKKFENLCALYCSIEDILYTLKSKYDEKKVKAKGKTGFNRYYKFYLDHEYNVFNTKEEMCKHWGISVEVYDKRIANGISQSFALSVKDYIEHFEDIEVSGVIYNDLYNLYYEYSTELDVVKIFNWLRKGKAIRKALPVAFIRKYVDVQPDEDMTIETEDKAETTTNKVNKGTVKLNIKKHIEDSVKDYTKPIKGDILKKLSEVGNMREVECSDKEYNSRRRIAKLTHEESKGVTFKDPFGIVFNTVKEMCEYYGTIQKYLQIETNSYDLATALKNLATKNRECFDPKSEEQGTVVISDMPQETVEETACVRKQPKKTKQPIKVKVDTVLEYMGTTYATIDGFCNEFHASSYRTRLVKLLNKGYSLENSILRNCDKYKSLKPYNNAFNRHLGYSKELGYYVDHEGNKFLTIDSLLEYYGLDYNLVYKRYSRGCTTEECLKGSQNKFIEYEGVKYKTLEVLCSKYNLPYDSIKLRLKDMSIEEAIQDYNKSKYSVTDHKGNKYSSYSEMAEKYDMTPSQLYQRLGKGWSLQEALETPVRIRVVKKK